MTKLGIGMSLLAVILLAGAGFLAFKYSRPVLEKPLITNFEECAIAGYPVIESYPAQCRTESGELFVQEIENPNPNPTPVAAGGCFIGGCSGQICSDQEGVASTCEYREEYACYKTAKCERQASGQCGWTPSVALTSCLNSSGDNTLRIAAGYVGGHVTIGPFCPVERVDEPCNVPPEAYTSREAVVYASNSTTIMERVHLDAQGNYKVTIAPGDYYIQIVPAGIGPGEKKYATVKSFETATVDFDIDTGIR